ncbi:2Fe-2S iron-sulfur cluster binding domain-containing protein [Permianibacter sp. IMCC34836]|uniref:2Fe-2S iron-sulfur cluster-binding protein n=1 Tax=Permianibacter fluminis TaxID=2738515 RepID=UPI001551FA74|nr:2Fe-2S iron-sulfur cluster-binding protein [Permianibacter fluminis]NQD35717.1 2Fe-2S iron-sulfur cluster binding domain-containing protein [Permianibacter fluminis]
MSTHFRVTLQPSGHVLAVQPGESVLAAALRLGYDAPFACQQAACGICRGRVLSGTLIYEDDVKPYGLFEQEIADGYVLLCQAIPTSDAHVEWHDVRAPGEFAVKKISCAVQSLTALTDDTWRVLLQLPAHTRVDFHAGQYLQLHMPEPTGSGTTARAFSIASAPEQTDQLELHIRAVAEHTSAREVIRHLQTRSVVTIELPFGQCRLPNNDKPLLLLAGGTGFAPMKALIESSLARAETRALHLYWGAQTTTGLYWHRQLLNLAAQHPQLRYTPVLSHPDADWTGATGFPHLLAAAEHPDLNAFEVFVSGSEAMARAIYQNYLLRGVPEAQFHCDWIDLLRGQGAL